MSEKIKVTFYASTGYVNSKIKVIVDIDKSEWEEMSFEDKQEMLHEVLYNLDYGWYEENE